MLIIIFTTENDFKRKVEIPYAQCICSDSVAICSMLLEDLLRPLPLRVFYSSLNLCDDTCDKISWWYLRQKIFNL